MRCVWRREAERREAKDKVEFVCILFWVVQILWCGWFRVADFSAAVPLFWSRVVILVCTIYSLPPPLRLFAQRFFLYQLFLPRLCIHGGAKTATKWMEKYCELK